MVSVTKSNPVSAASAILPGRLVRLLDPGSLFLRNKSYWISMVITSYRGPKVGQARQDQRFCLSPVTETPSCFLSLFNDQNLKAKDFHILFLSFSLFINHLYLERGGGVRKHIKKTFRPKHNPNQKSRL